MAITYSLAPQSHARASNEDSSAIPKDTSLPSSTAIESRYQPVLKKEALLVPCEPESAWEISECIIHAVLGKLSSYQSGFLHRDISTGNILTGTGRLTSPAILPREGAILEDGLECALPYTLMNSVDGARADLEALLQELGFGSESEAIITDDDIAADLRGAHLDEDHRRARSGTQQFRSEYAVYYASGASRPGGPYLYPYSSLDDLESFYWTALWVLLYQRKYRDDSSCSWEERAMRDYFNAPRSRDNLSATIEAANNFYGRGGERGLNPMLSSAVPALFALKDGIYTYTTLWQAPPIDMVLEKKPDKDKAAERRLHSRLFTYVAFHRAFTVIMKYKSALCSSVQPS